MKRKQQTSNMQSFFFFFFFLFFVPPSLNKPNETQPTNSREREKNRTIAEVETRKKNTHTHTYIHSSKKKKKKKRWIESSSIRLEVQTRSYASLSSSFLGSLSPPSSFCYCSLCFLTTSSKTFLRIDVILYWHTSLLCEIDVEIEEFLPIYISIHKHKYGGDVDIDKSLVEEKEKNMHEQRKNYND